MASLSNSRWQNREECSNQSTNNRYMAVRAMCYIVREEVSEWVSEWVSDWVSKVVTEWVT